MFPLSKQLCASDYVPAFRCMSGFIWLEDSSPWALHKDRDSASEDFQLSHRPRSSFTDKSSSIHKSSWLTARNLAQDQICKQQLDLLYKMHILHMEKLSLHPRCASIHLSIWEHVLYCQNIVGLFHLLQAAKVVLLYMVLEKVDWMKERSICPGFRGVTLHQRGLSAL